MRTDPIGKNNPRLIDLRKAIRNGTLTADGLLPIEGRKLIEEARRSGLDITDMFIRLGESSENMDGKRIHIVEPSVFKSIQSTETSQGIVALVRPKVSTIDHMLTKPNALVVILARVQDPGNVGTILRVAESFGVSGCIGLTGSVSPYNPKTVRASAGSLFRLPHVWQASPLETFEYLKRSGLQIIGTAADAVTSPESCDWRRGTALVVGNEGGGLNVVELDACDLVVGVRQNPAVESLNCAIAAAIILYESSKQRGVA